MSNILTTNTWKGVVIEESLTDTSLLAQVKIVGTKVSRLEQENRVLTFHKIEVPDSVKQEYVDTATKVIKDSFYTHLCKDGQMIVIFKNKVFAFTQDDPELVKAQAYGKSIGIIPAQMPFEHLVGNPFD